MKNLHNPLDVTVISKIAQQTYLESLQRPRYIPLPPNTFPAASLTTWLDVAVRAGARVVPATVVGSLKIDHLLKFDQSKNDPSIFSTLQKLDAINRQFSLESSIMLRWDCCASDYLKYNMGCGLPPDEASRYLSPDDVRAFEILMDFPSEEIKVVTRPWIQAKIIERFPVEFRVFVENGKVEAIANYYLQRDLPDDNEIRFYAKKCVDYTRLIVQRLIDDARYPSMPHQPTPENIAASLDFIVDQYGQVLLLEAGPGYRFGAHPCSFMNKDERTVATLQGLSLGSGIPSIPLSTL